MSTPDPFVAGARILSFRLIERVSASVWRAEDTRSGRAVAIKVLTKQLPRDESRREMVIRDMRQGAALYHSSLVTNIDVAQADDALVLVMEWFESQPVSVAFRGRAANRSEFLRIAYQLVDAVKLMHVKNVLHLNIAGDSVLVAADGQVKLAGLNASTFLPRREGQGSAFAQKGSDPDAVSYMSPELITNQPLTVQSDVFSLGILMYEIATGRRPYLASTAPEIARKIVDEQPPSPKAINPEIDSAVLSVMGKCFYKDPYRRYKDTKAIIDEIVKADADVVAWSNDLSRAALNAASAARQAVQARQSIILAADVANHDEINAVDPASAAKAVSRMQQILGESVYLFDGQVVDPFGARFVGELPSLESALEAGRKGEFDFSPGQQEGTPIPVRLLLHAGEVETRDGSPAGPAVDKAFEILDQIEPQKLYITEAVLRKGRTSLRLRDAGARAGVKLFAIAPDAEAAEEAARATAATEESARIAAEAEAEATAAATLAARKKKRARMGALAIAGVVLVVLAIVAFFALRSRRDEPAPVAVSRPAGLPRASAATPRKVFVERFTVTPPDPVLQQRADAIQLAAIEVLRSFPEVRITDAKASDVSAYTAKLTGEGASPQIIAVTDATIAKQGTATPLLDASGGVQEIINWITSDLKIAPRGAASAEAYNAFADAVAANAANDVTAAEKSLRTAIQSDPNFLAAQLFALHFFDAHGKEADATAAAKQILAQDPANMEALRRVARASVIAGDLAAAFQGYAAVLQHDRSDAEALNIIGRYALAAGDDAHFNAAISRLGASDTAAIHPPDLLVASGRIDDAVDKYYDIERRLPHNSALALKIGRIAVLRHSAEMAEIELKKVEESDPNYGAHILKAYIAAQSGNKAAADAEMKLAAAFSTPRDDYWTTIAEIAAMNGDVRGVDDALDRAVTRKEPTASYVLTNPLFGFLRSDARFQAIRGKLKAQQDEIRSALAGVTI
ncbi:MAG: eukaryotic-like serine/threonine-protein kinase [Thermoanaerobaculia bacterium]|jgi:Tfp pilus assembly protein PilF|nr:eukaryotic-like serine/threonine-protein kinase [Thermoanaerobaculia bacterium]